MDTMPFAEATTEYNADVGEAIVCVRVGRVPEDQNLYLTVDQAADLIGLLAGALAGAVI